MCNGGVGVGEERHYLRGRSYSRDLDRWTPFQGSKQLLMAIPTQSTSGWIEEEEEPLC